MAIKKKAEKANVETKAPVVKVKSVIKKSPAAKTIVKKESVEMKQEKTIPLGRIQTAEGWKRQMLKKLKTSKKN